MSENETGQEKNEDPTQLRREKARKKGQVANSTDLTNGCPVVGRPLRVEVYCSEYGLEADGDVA